MGYQGSKGISAICLPSRDVALSVTVPRLTSERLLRVERLINLNITWTTEARKIEVLTANQKTAKFNNKDQHHNSAVNTDNNPCNTIPKISTDYSHSNEDGHGAVGRTRHLQLRDDRLGLRLGVHVVPVAVVQATVLQG